MSRTAVLCTSIAAIALISSAALLTAGPLTPAAGPVASTYKTLTEVEPRIPIGPATTPGDANSLFRISAPGSYYLTGNVTGVSGKSGIEIASNGVTLDLSGYTVQGVAGSLTGIIPDSGLRTLLIVRNGMVAGWGADGIDLDFGSPSSSQGAVIEDVLSVSNIGDGIKVPDGSSVSRCLAARNGGFGFVTSNNAIFVACTAQGNTANGFGGGFGCIYRDCVSRSNGGSGFAPSGTSKFTSCSATGNTSFGFELNNCQALDCFTGSNLVANFRINGGCHVTQCEAQAGPVGFDVFGNNNTIERNKCVLTTTVGIRVTGTANLIIGNSASGGPTRYSIAGGNSAGPILTAALMPPATNPTANYDH